MTLPSLMRSGLAGGAERLKIHFNLMVSPDRIFA